MMRTSMSGSISLMRSRAPMPPRPGILRSRVTTSIVPSPTMVRASLPLLAVRTSQSLCRIARSDSRTPRSSSTINSRGRPGLVEVGLLQRLVDDLALELVDGGAERLPAFEHRLLDVAGLVIGPADLLGHVFERDHGALGEHEEPLDQVLELADVPGPRIAQQRIDGLGAERLLRHAHLAGLR